MITANTQINLFWNNYKIYADLSNFWYEDFAQKIKDRCAEHKKTDDENKVLVFDDEHQRNKKRNEINRFLQKLHDYIKLTNGALHCVRKCVKRVGLNENEDAVNIHTINGKKKIRPSLYVGSRSSSHNIVKNPNAYGSIPNDLNNLSKLTKKRHTANNKFNSQFSITSNSKNDGDKTHDQFMMTDKKVKRRSSDRSRDLSVKRGLRNASRDLSINGGIMGYDVDHARTKVKFYRGTTCGSTIGEFSTDIKFS